MVGEKQRNRFTLNSEVSFPSQANRTGNDRLFAVQAPTLKVQQDTLAAPLRSGVPSWKHVTPQALARQRQVAHADSLLPSAVLN